MVNLRRPFKQLILAGLVLLLTSCTRSTLETTPSSPGLAAIVTWNMNAGVGNLQRLLADLDGGRLTDGPMGEAVVLLQEAVAEDAVRLQRAADARGWSMFLVPVRYDGHRTRSNAILSSRPLLQPRVIPLPQERQARSAVAAFIELGSQRMFVVSAHLENRAGGWKVLFSDAARGRQADTLIRELPADEPGIVGGDLNTWLGPHEPAWLSLARRFPDTPATRTPTFGGRLVLDHLFFDLPDGWRAATRVVPDTYGSDHHPVVAVISAHS
jgi:endonuclease/exonuclease/phosphatase family metal-dependent hydrolase